MKADWTLIILTFPMVILAVGVCIMMLKSDDGPTERERILSKTIDAMLEAQRQELAAKNSKEQP